MHVHLHVHVYVGYMHMTVPIYMIVHVHYAMYIIYICPGTFTYRSTMYSPLHKELRWLPVSLLFQFNSGCELHVHDIVQSLYF